MRQNRFKRSIVLPTALLAYLGVMAWLGRGRFVSGDYLYYFGVIGGSLLIILLLFLSLRRRERLRQEREDADYGTYADAEGSASEDSEERPDA